MVKRYIYFDYFNPGGRGGRSNRAETNKADYVADVFIGGLMISE